MARQLWRVPVLVVLLVVAGTAPAHAQVDEVGGGGLAPLPAQLPCVAWPTAGWPTGEIPGGVDVTAAEALAEDMVGPEGGDSVVVIHGGRIVLERYAEGQGPDLFLPSFSLSKSFAATMLGMLVDDGLVALDDRAPIAEWADDGDPRRAITVRHLVTMTSGLEWSEVYGDETADPFQLQQEADHAAFVIARPLAAVPGTRFLYSTGDTAVLSKVIAEVADVQGPSYVALLRERIFDPLGMDPALPGLDDVGIWRGGSTTITTTRNYAKLGHLYLRGGMWEGRQLLSREWVDFARSPTLDPGYGAGFWLMGEDQFWMIGLLGQGVAIVPSLDLVVAVNNHPQRTWAVTAMIELFAGAEAPTCPDEPAPVAAGAEAAAAGAVLPATGRSHDRLVGAALGALVLGLAAATGARRRPSPS